MTPSKPTGAHLQVLIAGIIAHLGLRDQSNYVAPHAQKQSLITYNRRATLNVTHWAEVITMAEMT